MPHLSSTLGSPVPTKRRKFSAFAKILLALTFMCGLFVAGGYYVITTFEPLDTRDEPEPGCRLSLSDGRYDMEVSQAVNAATVGGVAFSRNMPEEAVTVAYATVWQESTFYNVQHGDRDSLGLFQQRPSQEWGEPEEILDPVLSSRAFYDELAEVSGWEELPVYEAAQRVQRSAHGFAYDQHEDLSARMAETLSGRKGPAVTCWFASDDVTEFQASDADTAGALDELTRVFGTDPATLPTDDPPQTGDLGWAMALWSVVHAEEYGLTSVTYDGQQWQASNGLDGAEAWSEVDDDTGGRVVLR
ncbi:heavy metal transporter [Nocardiopsis oceani]